MSSPQTFKSKLVKALNWIITIATSIIVVLDKINL